MSDPPTIILADHDSLVRDVLRVEFSHAGFVVLVAANGPEAEDFAGRTIARLAVFDVALPGLGGYDACARIRRLTGYHDTPIVLTTQERSARIDAAAQKAGATALLVKPYSFNDLINTLSPHLPADDPLLVHRPKKVGMGEVLGQEWGQPQTLEWRFGSDSGLSRNRLMLPIVRGAGVKVPLIRKP